MSIIASYIVPHPPLIIPEIGKGNESQINKTISSYKNVANEILELEPETIIISSPHTKCFMDYFFVSSSDSMRGDFSSFGAESVSFNESVDIELADEICSLSHNENFPAGSVKDDILLDHGTMVPLYFIREVFSKAKILVVGLSGLSHDAHFHFGEIISKAVEKLNRRVVFIASGDLSHKLQSYGPYGFSEDGPKYDKRLINVLEESNLSRLLEFDKEFLVRAAECGHSSFIIMAGAWNKRSVESKFFSYEDVTGVGYGIWSFLPKVDECVSLAKSSIEYYVKNRKKMEMPDNVSEELLFNKNGVFVSIHKFGNLRGCIGTFLPQQDNIAEEIIVNAISAATEDPRFPEITIDELDDLEINVDVLTEPEKIDSKDELDPKKYGVIVRNGFRRGLLLPDLEGVDTIDEQILIAKRKCGIKPEEDVLLERFEVVRHK